MDIVVGLAYDIAKNNICHQDSHDHIQSISEQALQSVLSNLDPSSAFLAIEQAGGFDTLLDSVIARFDDAIYVRHCPG